MQKNPSKYIRIFGIKARKHHLLLIICIGLGCQIAGDVYKHELAKSTGEVLLLPAAERVLAKLEGDSNGG